AAVARGRLYVIGGVGPAGLARRALVFDLERRRWSTAPGPSPREHLAAAAWNGRVYALGGRLAGIDTNLGTLQSFGPGARRWVALPPVPHPRGGTGAAALAGQIVSVGGEEPGTTIASVYAYDIAARRWRRLDDLPTPRHGLGVAALAGRVYAIGGGPRPGLFVSDANESLARP
ncbi:MAG: Kelch repeat-containing protein, partial [Gaiellaceae bacterium]